MTQMLHHRLEIQKTVCRVIKKYVEIWCHGYLKYLPPPLLYKVAKSVKSWLVITSCNVRHNTEVCNVEVRPMSRLDHCRDGPMLKLVQCPGIGQMSRHWSNVEALVQCRGIGPMSRHWSKCPNCVLIKSGESLSIIYEVLAKNVFSSFFGCLKMSNAV